MTFLLGFKDEAVKSKQNIDWSSNKIGGTPVSSFSVIYIYFRNLSTKKQSEGVRFC